MKAQIEIADGVYSKTEAWARCRSILDSVDPGDYVNDPGDLAFLRDLIARHPHVDEKIGEGIAHLTVDWIPPYNNNVGLWIARVDGTRTDVSLRQCLTPRTKRGDVTTALRWGIAGHVIQHKRRAFAAQAIVFCPISGEILTPSNCQVDHAPPGFAAIAEAFVDEEGGWGEVEIGSRDGMIGSRIVSEGQEMRWRQFHARYARLRLVSIDANQSRDADKVPSDGSFVSEELLTDLIKALQRVREEARR